MKLSAYLSLSRHGIFYFRWPLPRTDQDSRATIKISLRTHCPVRAGTLARYLASCGEITRDNSELARLRQDKLRELVRSYFDAQLTQYLEWINNRGLSAMAVEDARCEMLDHEEHLDSQRLTTMYLPIDRFKRKMDVQDEDWFDSLPNALTELRKGRRDLLRLVLEAAERGDGYSLGQAPQSQQRPLRPLWRLLQPWVMPSTISWPSIPGSGQKRPPGSSALTWRYCWNISDQIGDWEQ